MEGFRRPITAMAAVLFPLCTAYSAAQSPAEDLLGKQQRWEINCQEKGCILSADILRGYSGDPPDPNDDNQYISIALAVDWHSTQPAMLLFEVDPHADRDPGVFLTFAHSVRDGKGWKLLMDSDGQIRVPFKACATHQCTAGYGGGNPDAATLRSCADLVAKMQVQDHLFLSYYRQNHEYSTAVNLRIFREAYEKLLKNVAERPATTPEAAPRSSEHTVR